MSAHLSARIGSGPINRSKLKAHAALLAAGFIALQSGRVMGAPQSGTWIDTTTGGTWSNSANWYNSLVAGGIATGVGQSDTETGNNAIANFNSITLGGAITVHLDTNEAITTLNLGDVGNAYGWTIDNNNISSNTLTLQGNTYHGTLAAGTLPSINVANQTSTISAKLAVGGNGFQYTAWGLTGNGTLNLTNSADTWGGGIVMTGGTSVSPLTLNLNLSSGTAVGSLSTSGDYYGKNQVDVGQASTDYVVLNVISGTVNGSEINVGSTSGGNATVTVATGGALNAGGENGLNFQDQSSNAGSAILNVTGGSVGVQNNANISAGGYYGHSVTINESAGLIALYSDAGSTRGGAGAWYNLGGTENLNLTGGTFSVPQLVMLGSGGGRGAGTTNINLNGGTLQTTGSGNFVSNFNYSGSGAFSGTGSGTAGAVNLNVLAGGGTIDTYGGSVALNIPLVHGGTGTDGGINLNDSVSNSGTLTLYNGANTYTGPTTIARGSLVLQSGSTISASNAINIGPNGTFNVSALGSGFTTLSTQPISGAGAVVGTVTAPAGSITAGFGGVGGTLNFSGPLTLSGAGTAFDLVASSAGANGQIAANGGLTITASTTVDAIFSVLPISSQTYTLFTYSGSLTTAEENDLSLSLAGSAAGYNATLFALSYSTSGQINLVYTPASGTSSNLTWASTSSHIWDVSTTPNWNNPSLGSGANAKFNQGDNVTFDDTSGVTTAITLNAVAEPGAVTDSASSNNFSITGSGKISGTTNLTLTGNSTLTLGTANDFTGTTFITNSGTIVAVNTAGSATGATGVSIGNNGTLKIGDNSTAGAGIITGTITDNGSLVMNRPDTSTLPTGITGTGSLTQAGSGTTLISAQPEYSGATNITAGQIQYGVVNALPYSTALTLSGTGTLNVNGYGQTFNNVVTTSTGTNINLGGGNVTFNTTSPDILAGPITGTSASSIYLSGTANATLSNSVSIGTLALANNNVDNVTLNVVAGANVAVTALNVANGSANGGTGTVNQTGGVITAGTVTLGGTSTVSNNAVAIYTLSGGALNVSTGLSTAQSQNSRAFISISGTGAINMLGNSTLLLGNYYGEPTTIDQTGGTVSFASGSTGGVQVNGEGTSIWNLSGGVASIPRISFGGQALNNSYGVTNARFNFNGGTLQISAPSTAFFPANVYQGSGGALSSMWTTTVQSGGAVIDTDANAVTFINNLTHDTTLGSTPDGGLTLNDSTGTPGTLTLNASNSYTGNTVITNGTLALGPSGSINSSPFINVGPHGIFNVSGQPTYSPALNQVLGGTGTVAGPFTFTQGTITGASNTSAGTLTFSGPLTLDGGTALFNLATTSAASNDLIVASGGLNVSGGSIIDAVFTAAPTSTQTYLLFNYSGAALSTTAQGLLSLTATGSAAGITVHNLTLSFNNSTDQVFLKFTPGVGSAANLTWASTSSTAWDTTSTNWNNPTAGSGPNATFFSGDNVTFNDAPGVKTTITLNIAAQPGSVTISSNTNNFSFSGVGGISGTTGLNKTGTSNLTLATNNDYSGVTNLSGGTTTALNMAGYATGITSTTIASGAIFNIGNGTAGAGNATGAIINNGTLNINRPDTFTFPASVSVNPFTQMGAGTTILTGSSTYSGNTNILAGALQLGVNNALPSGTNVTVSNVAGSGFNLGSYSQTIGDLNTGALSTVALGTGQLTISGGDNMTVAGPVTGSAGSALYVENNATVNFSTSVSAGTLNVAPLDTDNSTVNFAAGTSNITNIQVCDGNNMGGTGTINQNGGTVNASNVVLANSGDEAGNISATYVLNAGTFNVSTGILMSNSQNTSSQLTINGGVLNLLNNSSITLGNYYGQPATITQNAGLVAFANGSTGGIQINGGGQYLYTLAGGELSIPRITFGGQAGSGYQYANAVGTFQFFGGTLQVTTSGQFFPSTVGGNNAHWVTTIGSGGAIVDTDGNNVLFTNSLVTDPGTSNDGGLTKIGQGTLTLAGADTYNGGTNVSVGTLALASTAAYPTGTPLLIASAAQVTLANHGANTTTVAVISTLTNHGTVDVVNNALDIQNNTIGSVSTQIAAAFHGGTWTGTSANGIITSSLAAADTNHLTAVGVATGLTTFEGNTAVPSTDVLVKYTYYGDANLDGMIDGSDYSIIDSTFLTERTTSTSISGWYNGDFNYDGVVNGSDYTLIDNDYNSQGAQISAEIASPTAQISGATGASSVPEPATLGLLGMGAAGLLGRRRRNGGR